MTTQDRIIAIADEIGGTVRIDYSGRNMFGKTCMGIVCDDLDEVMALAKKHKLPPAEADCMGMQSICYWPTIQAS